jgi:hypothetical protein
LWIVENFTKEDSYKRLVEAVKARGERLIEINGDFKYSMLDEAVKTPQCVIFLGSINMTAMVKAHLPECAPVAFNTAENYLCTKYYSHYGRFLFNDKYSFITLNELLRQKFYFYGNYGKESLIFLRPDSGQKTFQAQLVDLLDLDRFCEINKEVGHELVLVSTPKTIRGEWRFVVTKYKEIVSYSTYQYQGQITRVPGAPKGAIKLVEEMLEVGYYPDPVFVMDVCEDSDGDFWLLELNSFSSAGLYACDMTKIVSRVGDIARLEWEFYRNPIGIGTTTINPLLLAYAQKSIDPTLYGKVEITA